MSKTTDIGVIVGRFQTHQLHKAHIDLVEHVVSRHSKIILFLGVSKAVATKKNPLDFVTRKEMVQKAWPAITVLPIVDMKSDDRWSVNLDESIREVFPVGSVTLYGSRDSFIPHYKGRFATEVLEPSAYVSATDMRRECGRTVIASPEFRAGAIYSSQNRYNHVIPTVDVAVLRFKEGVGYEVCLVRKPEEKGYRFPGGHVDPTDLSLQMASRRETYEETGLSVDSLVFIHSYRVADWRYENEDDKIMTTFFAATYVSGVPKPGDDVCELIWVPVLAELDKDYVLYEQNGGPPVESYAEALLKPGVDQNSFPPQARSFGGVHIEPEHFPLSVGLYVYIMKLLRKEIHAKS